MLGSDLIYNQYRSIIECDNRPGKSTILPQLKSILLELRQVAARLLCITPEGESYDPRSKEGQDNTEDSCYSYLHAWVTSLLYRERAGRRSAEERPMHGHNVVFEGGERNLFQCYLSKIKLISRR